MFAHFMFPINPVIFLHLSHSFLWFETYVHMGKFDAYDHCLDLQSGSTEAVLEPKSAG
jgi:hypothetical protein